MSVSFPFWHIHTGNMIEAARREKRKGNEERGLRPLLMPIEDATAVESEETKKSDTKYTGQLKQFSC